MQPARSRLETNRRRNPAWLASRLYLPLLAIAFSPIFPHPFTSFSFLPRRKLFTRRILVARDEPGGYLLSIDRFWKQAKSFWPSSRGLTHPLLSLVCPFPIVFSLFSHLFHSILISPSTLNVSSLLVSFLPSSFWCAPFVALHRVWQMLSHFPCASSYSFSLFSLYLPTLVILPWEPFLHFSFAPNKRSSLVISVRAPRTL